MRNTPRIIKYKKPELSSGFLLYMELCLSLERDSSSDPDFFFSGTEKEKYQGQGMKSLAGVGAEPHKQ